MLPADALATLIPDQAQLPALLCSSADQRCKEAPALALPLSLPRCRWRPPLLSIEQLEVATCSLSTTAALSKGERVVL